MQNLTSQPNQNLAVATFDPAKTYSGASTLQLSESEMKALTAPFADLDYEIKPDGSVYLPQVLSLQRLNSVLGVGRWSLLLINTGSQEINPRLTKVFYDGALIVRNCFVARSAGEASYSHDNQNSSYATALEAAKTDCRTRCCKDLGVASDAWNPSFIRRWRNEYAIKVLCQKDGKRFALWRRKDLPAFENEIGPVPVTPVVPSAQPAQQNNTASELPWLNHGPDYDEALRELMSGKTLSYLFTKWKISKETRAALLEVMKGEWSKRLETVKDMTSLTRSYDDNKVEVEEYPWLKEMFSTRRNEIKSGKVKPVAA